MLSVISYLNLLILYVITIWNQDKNLNKKISTLTDEWSFLPKKIGWVEFNFLVDRENVRRLSQAEEWKEWKVFWFALCKIEIASAY